MKKICIVTTRHISYNPRVLKEADAFFSKGYDVTVVTVNTDSRQHRFDNEIMKKREWRLATVNIRKDEKKERFQWLLMSLEQLFYKKLCKFTVGNGIAEKASLKGFRALTNLAIGMNADFYIAHHAEALGVAFRAAKANGVGFGFDAEDYHSGMNESGPHSATDRRIAYLEKKYLPAVKYLTAASKGIGQTYAKAYGVSFYTILNVFPLQSVTSEKHWPVRFYWYSQVIGPNRSLEILLEAAAKIEENFELHLRGAFHSDAYQTKLTALIERYSLNDKVFIHEPILAEKIIQEAARYDVGLALESNVSVNRNICVTNKIFSYLMSGLGVIGTDTDGQKDIFSDMEEAVQMCRQNNADDLAEAMRFFIRHPGRLSAAKKKARSLAENRYNWDVESNNLLGFVEKRLSGAAAPVPLLS